MQSAGSCTSPSRKQRAQDDIAWITRHRMAYTVSKLTDYSAAALEKAAAECISCVYRRKAAVSNEAET